MKSYTITVWRADIRNGSVVYYRDCAVVTEKMVTMHRGSCTERRMDRRQFDLGNCDWFASQEAAFASLYADVKGEVAKLRRSLPVAETNLRICELEEMKPATLAPSVRATFSVTK